MAPEKIERTIQYFGLLKVPTDVKNIKWWRLSADIIRPHLSEYRNDKYPVPQGFWGYVQAMYAGRVLHTYRISYKNEILAFNIDTDLFLQQNISCSLEAVLSSFVEVGIALGKPVLQRKNPIKEWRSLSFPIDEFKIRLLAEQVVFKFTYEFEAQETCDVPEAVPPTPPPPPPPPKPVMFPPGTPDSDLPGNSPAYEGEDDNGETYKPGENPNPEFPKGEPCKKYLVTYQVINKPGCRRGNHGGTTEIYGEIASIYTDGVGSGDRNSGFIAGGPPPACEQNIRYDAFSIGDCEGVVIVITSVVEM